MGLQDGYLVGASSPFGLCSLSYPQSRVQFTPAKCQAAHCIYIHHRILAHILLVICVISDMARSIKLDIDCSPSLHLVVIPPGDVERSYQQRMAQYVKLVPRNGT